MQLSIEVFPAPFGPMMARISPFRMSNDTSVSAFTPPKASDTFSTASSTSPLVTTGESGALIRTRSRRLLQRRRLDRIGLHVADLDARRDDALAAVLERDLGADVALGGAVVERLDERVVALGDEAAADFQ